MKAEGFLDKVHGQYSRVLERKISLEIIDRSPKSVSGKRIYGCCVYIPIKLALGVLCELAHLVEIVATVILHGVGAIFANDAKKELLKAKKCFLIDLPSAVIECALRILLVPLSLLRFETLNLIDPFKCEADIRERFSYQKGIEQLKEWQEHARTQKAHDRIAEHIHSLENEVPVSILETFLTWRMV